MASDASPIFLTERQRKTVARLTALFKGTAVEKPLLTVDKRPKEQPIGAVVSSPMPSSNAIPPVSVAISSEKTVKAPPPLKVPFPRRSAHSLTEKDLVWLEQSETFISPIQRFDAISIVHMVSPSLFMVVSHFGNERPRIGRFLAIRDVLTKNISRRCLAKAVNFRPGMSCLVSYEGEYARAVIISEIRTRPYHYHCACLDIHAVIEVPSCDVFYLPRQFDTTNLPCNMFLAKIKGVGPIKSEVVEEYFHLFNDRQEPLKTACVISQKDQMKFFNIDFVLGEEWISKMLLFKDHADPLVFFSTIGKKWRKAKSRPIPSNFMPSPTAAYRIIEAMIEEGAYDFEPNASIFETFRLSLIPAQMYPGYDDVLLKICPDPTLLPNLAGEEPEFEKASLDTSGRASSPEVYAAMELPHDPSDESRRVQKRLDELKEELKVIGAGDDAEMDLLLSNWILSTTTTSSEPDDEWTKQLSALADELARNALTSNLI